MGSFYLVPIRDRRDDRNRVTAESEVMIPVDMTIHHAPPEKIGNCFQACLASILEMPLEQVPHVYEGEGWVDETGRVGMRRLQAWLRPLGYLYFEIDFEAGWIDAWADLGYLDCHYVFSGMGDRGVRHATVALNGRMVHDPHPSRSGVKPDEGKFLLGFIVKR